MISTPFRLGIVVFATAILVLMAIRRLARRQADIVELTAVEPLDTANNVDELISDDPNPTTAAFIEETIAANLNEISTLSELLVSTAPSSDIRQKIRHILTSAESAKTLLSNHTITIGTEDNLPSFKPISLNIRDFFETVAKKWSLILEPTNVTFTYHLDPSVPELLFADIGIMNRILDSLLSNSKSMTRRGRIHLHATAENPSKFNWVLKVIVADTGRGFPKTFKEDMRNNNSPIVPENGEQLNLIASEKLLQIIKGKLDINSVEGRGTEVTFIVPTRSVLASSNEDQASLNNPNRGLLSGKRVLIIEDDVSSQEVLQTYLLPEGCGIDCILDGNQALTALGKQSYDLILMDVRMDFLDGIKTTQAIRSSGKSFSGIPIITITADVDPDTNAKCMMAGADLFLNKPIGAKALFDGIRFVMDLGTDAQVSKTATS